MMKILMVCMGNICRSPLAEGILKTKLPADFQVDSAGTLSQHEGERPDRRSQKVAATHGIDISAQRARPISASDLENSDHIFCMDLDNFEKVISMAKNEEQRQKIKLLLEFAGIDENNFEVPDPYWGNDEEFEKLYNLLDRACTKTAAKLTGGF